MSMKNPLTLAGIEPATFRFVAQHLNHCPQYGAVGNLNGVKPNERVVKCRWGKSERGSEVLTSVVKWSEV